MTEQTVDTTPSEQPPAPIPCAICQSTMHTTGNHNGNDDPPASPQGNHNGNKAG
jgi:hypothetical protein